MHKKSQVKNVSRSILIINKLKLVVHIGKNKVGSSALQSFLCSHYNYLLRNNIFYPLLKIKKISSMEV